MIHWKNSFQIRNEVTEDVIDIDSKKKVWKNY